jgi:hypothetical protein
MRQFFTTVSLLVLLQSPAVVLAQSQASSQTPSDPIQQVLDAKLMATYPDGNFHPEQIVSRAELASILVKAFRLDKRETSQQAAITVEDVSPSNPAYNDIQVVLKTGIMKGYRGNLFFPEQRITRGEAFSIIGQAYGVFQFPEDTIQAILAKYPDSGQLPNWAKKSVATALYVGLVNTDEQANIAPNNPMTRGDVAYALSKYLNVPKQQSPEVLEEQLRQEDNF